MANGLALWVLGGTGVVLLYAAVKNETPQSVLLNALGQTTVRTPIASTAPNSIIQDFGFAPVIDTNGIEQFLKDSALPPINPVTPVPIATTFK